MNVTPEDRVTIAAFDFDGTLTRRDTVVPFLRRFMSKSRLAAALLPHAVGVVPAAFRRDRDQLRAVATNVVFRDRPWSEVAPEVERWGAEIVANRLRDDTTARLGWHLAQGHRVVIVSASYEPYVRVVADALAPGDAQIEVLATGLQLADGSCTGRLDGPNCRGPQKVRRLAEWLRGEGLERDQVTAYAYGDSAGDREMLEWSDHPHWVTKPLASVAP